MSRIVEKQNSGFVMAYSSTWSQMAQLSAFISAKNATNITMPAISHNSTVNMKTMGRRAKSLPAGMHKIQSSAGVNSGTWPHVQNIINTTSMYGLCVLTGAGGQS